MRARPRPRRDNQQSFRKRNQRGWSNTKLAAMNPLEEFRKDGDQVWGNAIG